MNRIDPPETAARLADRLFDETLITLAEARRSSGGAPFLSDWRDAGRASYFETPEPAAASSDGVFVCPASPDALIDDLVRRWLAEGNSGLAALGPHLKEISAALPEIRDEDDAGISVFCYTLF